MSHLGESFTRGLTSFFGECMDSLHISLSAQSKYGTKTALPKCIKVNVAFDVSKNLILRRKESHNVDVLLCSGTLIRPTDGEITRLFLIHSLIHHGIGLTPNVVLLQSSEFVKAWRLCINPVSLLRLLESKQDIGESNTTLCQKKRPMLANYNAPFKLYSTHETL